LRRLPAAGRGACTWAGGSRPPPRGAPGGSGPWGGPGGAPPRVPCGGASPPRGGRPVSPLRAGSAAGGGNGTGDGRGGCLVMTWRPLAPNPGTCNGQPDQPNAANDKRPPPQALRLKDPEHKKDQRKSQQNHHGVPPLPGEKPRTRCCPGRVRLLYP